MFIKRALTLIELLVVISIVVILAGLLLPALKQAREQGHSILCKGNMKQIGTAILNYSTDFNENIMNAGTPYICYWNGDYSASRPWFELLGNLGPYSQFDYGVKIGCLNNKNSYYKRNILCPSQRISDSSFSYTDYACNAWFFGTTNSTDAYKNHSLKMMQKPTEVVMVTDNGRGNDYCVTYPYAAGAEPYAFLIRSNHAGRTANFLFGDLHISSMIRERIGLDSTILRQGFDYTQGN